VRAGGSGLAGLGHGLGHHLEGLAVCVLLDEGEQVTLLLLDVVAHVLHQHGHLGVEPLRLGVHPVDLGEDPLGHVVLLEGLEDVGLDLVVERPADRVQHLLLDGRVDRELLHDALDQLGLGLVGPVPRILELLEQILDGLVVVDEHLQGVRAACHSFLHGSADSARPTRDVPAQNMCAPAATRAGEPVGVAARGVPTTSDGDR
jgi:hypothetical protein